MRELVVYHPPAQAPSLVYDDMISYYHYQYEPGSEDGCLYDDFNKAAYRVPDKVFVLISLTQGPFTPTAFPLRFVKND